MASASNLSEALLAELRHTIAQRGIVAGAHQSGTMLVPATIPSGFSTLIDKPLQRKPLAVAVDIYGTLLASAQGEIGSGGSWEESASSDQAFPPDMAQRLKRIVADDHARERARGIAWPEVDAPSVFARALDLDRDDGARACVTWECEKNACMAMPGALDFLSACSARGIPLGIVSNAQFYTPLFIEEAFGMDLFGSSNARPSLAFDPTLALWSYETGRAKPDRWMFDELARRYAERGIAADRILYIGNDALNDCAAAVEAGLQCALFCGDERSFKPRQGEARVKISPPSTLFFSWNELRRLVCT